MITDKRENEKIDKLTTIKKTYISGNMTTELTRLDYITGRLFYEIEKTLSCKDYPHSLNVEYTTTFLERLKNKDQLFLNFLRRQLIWRCDCIITGTIIEESTQNEIDRINIAVYLAINNEIEDLRVLLDCGVKGKHLTEKLCRIALQVDNIELFKLLDKSEPKRCKIREQYFREGYRLSYTPKIADYLLKRPKIGRSITHSQTYKAGYCGKDIIFYLICRRSCSQSMREHSDEYKQAGYTIISKKFETYMQGLTLHQLCIVVVLCRKVEVPDWFPKVLLEFSMC